MRGFGLELALHSIDALKCTKKTDVTKALREFIARREQRQMAELLGKLEWDPAFDSKAERSRNA